MPRAELPPEMPAPVLDRYLGRIQDTHAIPALRALADEIAAAYPTGEATPTLQRVIAAKLARLTRAS